MIPYEIYFKILSALIIFTCMKLEPSYGHVLNNTNTKEILNSIINEFQNEFITLKNDELQVPAVNEFYGSLKFLHKKVEPQKKLEELSYKLKSNIDFIYKALHKAKHSFKARNGINSTKYRQAWILPCDDSLSIADHVKNHSSRFLIDQILNNLFYDLWTLKTYIKQVYILSLTDTSFEDPYFKHNCCGIIDHSILWRTYMSHNKYKTRRIILLLDHGSSVDDNDLGLSKLLAKQMIAVLNNEDRFTVIAIASKWSSLEVDESCGNEHLPSILSASDNNKELSNAFIDGVTSKNEITDHSMGMKIATKMARLFYAGNDTVLFLYITSGMEFSMSEAMDILATSDLTSPLIMNICAISSNIMSGFLLERNYVKNKFITKGRLIFISEEQSIGPSVAKFYDAYLEKNYNTTMKNSLPIWDYVAQDLFVSLSIGFPIGNKLVVIGIDVIFTKFFEDIIFYSHYQKDMYSILMNCDGIMLLHPSMPLNKLTKQIKFTDVSNVFSEPSLKENVLTKSNGNLVFRGIPVKYIWQQINNLYIILLVVKNVEEITFVPSKVNWLSGFASDELMSHLVDLASTGPTCKYLGHDVNLDSPSLYLSRSCFQSGLTKTNDSTILKLLSFRKSDELYHEGLQEGIQEELYNILQVIDLLQKNHVTSLNSEYVVRRFIATKSGILSIFPNVVVRSDFVPSERPWFTRANELKGKIVVSPPYLDNGGAGYIVTISFATRYVVLGIDVTYGFMLKLMLDQYVDCFLNITCFLVNDRGYLITHPDLLTSLENDDEPVEQLHIVHKESSVANDLLNHEEFVQKLACNDYSTATIQRYYQFNMNFQEILTSTVLGEPCISYSIGPIMGTNLFFGVVKAACPISRTFCPCSVVDRICLNCKNMEKEECECPCECQIHRSSCSNYTSHDDYKLCDPFLQRFSSDPTFNDRGEEIEPCSVSICEGKLNYLSCLGVIGCEWCMNDTYGFPLSTPFCTTMLSCFNGVLGSPSPYQNRNVEVTQLIPSMKNTGYIFGLIIIFGILFILIFVCWRSYGNASNNQRIYTSARQEEHLHMSDLNVNDDFLEQGNHSDKLLIDEKKRSPISPYCVTSNYSRPATAADSDHGYSTMTPHDESEHLSLAPIEIDSLEEDIASDRATPPVKHKIQLTKIPHRNCIIVPVTVHRNVDAT
ncbi:hypothetical protein WA026_008929 [Henosepilachna vigintioctopunctata]|uniref:VWFA and cache domain-containing protein 1 n=1 Tax=Henosepilachna vigintioctopunctata TaxID=420089 RepID=A0AAW1V4D8_9CUCU